MDRKIEDYALIGDCHTAALVSKTGSIDWLCFPRFDSPAVFARLLGNEDNGFWRIAPTHKDVRSTRKYRDGTLILETEHRTSSGSVTVIDFMPPRDGRADLIRIVVCDEGEVELDFDLVMRFDYGRSVPWVTRLDETTMSAVAGPNMLILRTPVPMENKDMRTTGRFSVKRGERVTFSLVHQLSYEEIQSAKDPEDVLEDTHAFWTDFSSRCPDVGPWTKDVKRSLITLKALIYQPTGGIVAAATTSLPEWIGGNRNWDYRYCWLRDSSMTLMAMMELGFYEEAYAWRDWLMRSVAGDPAQMQIMYGVAGERQLVEWEASWLTGFRDSGPIRVGNAAAAQFQLDVYGEVSEMFSLARKSGMDPHPRSVGLAKAMLTFLEGAWREPDEGIWEMRGGRKHFVHSKCMAWLAFNRAATFAETEPELSQFCKKWRKTEAKIRDDIIEKGYDEELGSFVQYYGSKTIDASLLQLILVGFLPIDDPRILGTVKAVETHLMQDGFVARYDTNSVDDGTAGKQEGKFLFCSFWMIDVYNLLGRRKDARTLFEQIRALQNDVGLLSEEYDPASGAMLGNFPQAFSHVGLINSALSLARSVGPAEKRVEPDKKNA